MYTVLFEFGPTYSYVSMKFALGFDAICDVLDTPIHVYALVGEFIIITHVYRAYSDSLWDFKLGLT